MKILLFILLFPLLSYSQDLHIQYEGNFVKIPIAEWQQLRDNFYITMLNLDEKSSIVELQKSEIEKYQNIILFKDSSIYTLRQSYNDCLNRFNNLAVSVPPLANVNLQPIMEWQGFFLGLSTHYSFADSIITKASFINGLQYSIYANANVRVWKLQIQPIFNLPLSKNPCSIELKAGYKLF